MRKRLALTVAVALGLFRYESRAHETDQYTVPQGRQFADLGPFFSRYFLEIIDRGVDRANQAIVTAMERRAGPEAVQRLQAPERVAASIYAQFPSFMTYIDDVEKMLDARELRERFPGLLIKHRPANWVYSEAFPLDVRALYKFWGSSTILIGGTYLGTDKIGHIVHNGYYYFQRYRAALAEGKSEQEATAIAIGIGVSDDFFRSEQYVLGYLTSGVFSNADLAANYVGLKLFLNLTEEVRVGERCRPSILVLKNGLWRFRDGVNERSDFFTGLITDHLDEALNPNLYGAGLDLSVRGAIARRCDAVRAWYADINGRPPDQEFFSRQFEQLRTFFGESYGHHGTLDEVIGVVNVCFGDSRAPRGSSSTALVGGPQSEGRAGYAAQAIGDAGPGGSIDELGRSPLHRAARAGSERSVSELLSNANPNFADVDQMTPLHEAVRLGHDGIVKLLLTAHADANARAKYGVTPLHLAARHRPGLIPLLVAHHAEPNSKDAFGCAPLHDAAAIGEYSAVAALLSEGAVVNIQDSYGNSPLHLSARGGHAQAALLLLGHGATVEIENDAGRTPYEEAAKNGHRPLATMLRRYSQAPRQDQKAPPPALITATGATNR